MKNNKYHINKTKQNSQCYSRTCFPLSLLQQTVHSSLKCPAFTVILKVATEKVSANGRQYGRADGDMFTLNLSVLIMLTKHKNNKVIVLGGASLASLNLNLLFFSASRFIQTSCLTQRKVWGRREFTHSLGWSSFTTRRLDHRLYPTDLYTLK